MQLEETIIAEYDRPTNNSDYEGNDVHGIIRHSLTGRERFVEHFINCCSITTVEKADRGESTNVARYFINNICYTVATDTTGEDWATPIVKYLADGILPTNKHESDMMMRNSSKYELIDGILFRRGYLLPLERCVRKSEVEYVIADIHQGVCGSHIGARALECKVRRLGFYWPKMREDIESYIRRCDSCQKFANIPKQAGEKIRHIPQGWPFHRWGMDIIGPFPPGKGQLKYLVVAIDYFSKWIEAQPLATISSSKVIDFFHKNILTRYGAPKYIVTDNGSQFSSRQFRDYCEDMKIIIKYSSVAHPQTNGQAEVANRIVKRGMQTMLGEQGRNWVDELPSVLWSYRTTPSSATGESPFSLVYGMEAVIPVEIGLPSPRAVAYKWPEEDKYDDPESIELHEMIVRMALEDVTDKREKAYAKMMKQQLIVDKQYNTNVRERRFKVGDLVLRKLEATGRQPDKGKLTRNWEGPYKVIEAYDNGAYRLADMEGRELTNTWNIQNLRKYYT